MPSSARAVTCALALSSAMLAAYATPCAAQENNSLAVGVNVTLRAASDSSVSAQDSIGIRWRLGHGQTGWGWSWGLNWYTTHLQRRIGERTVDLGKLRIRPFLVGYGYTYAISERLAVRADVLAGPAYSSFTMTPEADDAYHALPAHSIRSHTEVTAVVKPEAGLWLDLSRRVGVSVDFGYIVARPMLTVESSIGRDARRVRADSFLAGVGVVYRIF